MNNWFIKTIQLHGIIFACSFNYIITIHMLIKIFTKNLQLLELYYNYSIMNYINIKIRDFVNFPCGEILMGQHLSSPIGERSIFFMALKLVLGEMFFKESSLVP